MKKEYDLNKLKKRKSKLKVDKSSTKVPISLRLDGSLLASLKDRAQKKGIPYQTYISSILFQFNNGEIIEKKILEELKSLLAS